MKLSVVVADAHVTLAAQALALVARENMLEPQEDPFYQPPEGRESKEVGTILRTRKVQMKTLVEENLKEAWQLLYRTTYRTEDEPTTTVTTVMVPHNAQNDSLVMFGDFEDTGAPECAPSDTWRAGIDIGCELDCECGYSDAVFAGRIHCDDARQGRKEGRVCVRPC